MRFRFCGDLDCPDWVLAEMGTLSKMTSIKMKLLCVQVIKSLWGEEIDFEKVTKLTADAKFEPGDMKASISALSFILSSATKYNVDAESLLNELQQLGLPKEHSTSLCKSYSDAQSKLEEAFRKQSMRLSNLESVDWRVDYVLSSSHLKNINEPSVQLKLAVTNPDVKDIEQIAFNLSPDKLRLLIHELKHAQHIMDGL